ncbi:ribulose-5-phosphate 4-epimerase/fuculose-1-phosphate aldolase [Pararhizobium capsulatum DSM 1112]|uniref:Ribulose-5-phosphate 4-epimerase/fuculose-1-phosphate aldolase n=1 Tax=Pararhizobium capsulatum DSM 1112 TaxID=1121113 RepID=A0ABU0C253_9HYPH|nr:ribulose-5-phosphate 4-epimerase/fuculose-1-phosphate aldolase [Pararhizobium capsulatum DSM 1112]
MDCSCHPTAVTTAIQCLRQSGALVAVGLGCSMPGDPEMGAALCGLAGKRSAVLLANHGPIVAGKDLDRG